MLKNLGYDGIYKDEHMSVGVLLENPSEHGHEAAELVFSVQIKTRNSGMAMLRLEDFTFYIMDEANKLYNTRISPYSKDLPEDDELICKPDGLIHTDFLHAFLFQDLRIAFYYCPYAKIEIIKLNH